MSFFNKKEDVIAIELTPHGRKLLSHGKLKPAYYAFFDDDILYESQKGGFTETNSQTKNRILNETPRIKPQTNFKGADSKISDMRTFETENQMLQPIGSNKIEEQKSNGWDITFLHNTASSAVSHFTSNTSPTLQIPQIEATISFEMKVGLVEDATATDSFELFHPDATNGGTFVNITEEQIMLNILEKNGFNENEGLEIQVYLYEQDKQSYKLLLSQEKETEIKNDMFVKPLENSAKSLFETRQTTTNPDLVEYWLRIKVDEDISVADRCSGLKNLEKDNIYLENELICPDEPGALADIYSTSVADLEDCEE